MAKDSSLEKYELPGRTVTVSLPKNIPESRVRQVKCNNLKIASKIAILIQKAHIKIMEFTSINKIRVLFARSWKGPLKNAKEKKLTTNYLNG